MRLTYRDSTVPHTNAKGELWKAYSDANYNEIINKLADYEDAEEQGRMVILPKILYEADSTPLIMGVTEWEVTGVRFYDGIVQAYTVKTKNAQSIIYGREIGETIFLTREEAEATLNGGQDE